MISTEKKQEVISKYQRKAGDTGSCEVQVALLTARIKEVTEHLASNKNDKHSRRGLIALVARNYLIT